MVSSSQALERSSGRLGRGAFTRTMSPARASSVGRTSGFRLRFRLQAISLAELKAATKARRKLAADSRELLHAIRREDEAMENILVLVQQDRGGT